MTNSLAKKAAIVLSGNGVFDGSEIHEAVITLLNLQKRGVQCAFFAPDIEQAHTINHLNGEVKTQNRNVLEESARIARGNITDLSQFNADNFDMILFVGGFGAAKNLSTFAFDGTKCKVNADVERAINNMIERGKKLGFLCIAPVIAARVISKGVKVTIGNDPATAQAINAMGATHIDCPANSFVKDQNFNTYSTPAYMLAENAAQVDEGVSAMIAEMTR